ncbi:class I SAM-dependent methyltransferase [Sulfitobacter guttiformis]|uniref:Ubiquinone/menaquinone biosynthesis C-methylase UbiE n=1 Tax=Sulfitobacter guttiformis TaxID=74349 RepID=A0A420DMG5_9RHOB|nr:class I SAM-dependent methyltransferase [Sulfitobacter guttiformis]KIN72785.1 Methyltransferase, UbiE/COQ5 family [Sulfitobacter guttiformis KCTC 32187]RKE95476.1 ubiquinone/menaquinone biosynthesis C-methylase UbiE [Sulfitobacter guttiformis]
MSTNSDQRDFWTDEAGPVWIDQRAAMDDILAGVLDGILRRAELDTGHSVLDIGCGAGTSTLAISERVGEAGHVTGIDISRTLLKAAHARLTNQTNIAFLDVDAQSHPFVTDSADRIVSRFGVMFFDDNISAFRNMASALRADAMVCFAVWGAIAENPFFTLPAQVSRNILGPVPKSDPDAPGPFSLRDPDHIHKMMRDAGLEAQIEVVQEPLVCSAGAQALAETMCHIGPAHMALAHYNADAEMRDALKGALVEALGAYQSGDTITLPAQINYVTARKSS